MCVCVVYMCGLCMVCVHVCVCVGALLVCALCGICEYICTRVYMCHVYVEYDVCGICVSVYVLYTWVCL